MAAALTLDGVRVRFGDTTAVDGLSLEVRAGEIVGLLGPNGSGKSSTLAVAAGVLDPECGTAAVDGVPRATDPARYAARVGLVPQEPALYDELSAEANLVFFARLYGCHGFDLWQRVERGLAFARLVDRRHDRVGTLSGGWKHRLNLAVALLHDPDVVLLDEPTSALDPASRDTLFAELHELRDRGHAILLTTHHLDEAEHGCDRIAVLDHGRMVACGRPADLVRSSPGAPAVLYGHLRERLPRFFERGLRKRLGPDVALEITGRRLRLAASTPTRLGEALAVVLADGIVLETFRTPPVRLELLLRGETVAPPATPDIPAAEVEGTGA